MKDLIRSPRPPPPSPLSDLRSLLCFFSALLTDYQYVIFLACWGVTKHFGQHRATAMIFCSLSHLAAAGQNMRWP